MVPLSSAHPTTERGASSIGVEESMASVRVDEDESFKSPSSEGVKGLGGSWDVPPTVTLLTGPRLRVPPESTTLD